MGKLEIKVKAIIWGHKLYSHTSSFVHYGFFKAFKHLGYETLWLDNNDDISGIDFNNCIFLTEGQVERNIPLNKTCTYIGHNINADKYKDYKSINIQIYHNYINKNEKIIEETHPTFQTYKSLSKIDEFCFFDGETIYQPWATDLLPDEINIDDANNEINNRECVWVGTYGDRTSKYQNSISLDMFFTQCIENNISIKAINPWNNVISVDKNKELVNKAFLAPAIQGPWQIDIGYSPCRIFKNISYGHVGITNNIHTNNMFEENLVYSNDINTLFELCLQFKTNHDSIKKIKNLMKIVKDKHTYINRLNNILKLL